jgi:bacterioferritin-associated ferredoxin
MAKQAIAKQALTQTTRGQQKKKGRSGDSNLSIHDQVQIALAIAEEKLLQSLLVDSTPPLVRPQCLGSVTSSIGIPIQSGQVIDGLIQFEEVRCVMAKDPVRTDPQTAKPSLGHLPRLGTADLMRCESDLHTLGEGNLSMAQAIALLAHSGFTPEQVEDILNLPYEAWHKTWWYTLDAYGHFTVPFLRILRTLRYPNGTFTIQYRDYYAQTQPSCFRSTPRQVLVEIASTVKHFSQTLEKINRARFQCGIDTALLICNHISDLAAQGFISQGISIYSHQQLNLPIQSNCASCANQDCPMHGRRDSPVLMCRSFCLTGDLE